MRTIILLALLVLVVGVLAVGTWAHRPSLAAEPKQPDPPARLKVVYATEWAGGAMQVIKDEETGQEYLACVMFNARGNAVAVTPMVGKKQ